MSEKHEINSETQESEEIVSIIAEMQTEQLSKALHSIVGAQSDLEVGWIQFAFVGSGKVVLSAIGHHLAIKYEFLCSYQGEGVIKVSGKQLSDYVNELPSGKVSLKADLPNKLTIKCGRSIARLPLIQDSNYASVSAPDIGTSIQIKGESLNRWVNAFRDFVLVDDSRYYANGAYIWLDSDNCTVLNAVASDALRLAKTRLTDDIRIINNDKSAVLVPKKSLDEISRISKENPGNIFSIKWNQDELFFSIEFDSYFMVSKCIAGSYPPYEAAIPKQVNTSTQLDIKILQEAVKRTLVLADKTKVVRFLFESNSLNIQSNTSGMKEGDDTVDLFIPINTSFEVNYSGNLLIGLLGGLSGTKATFEWESPTRPVRITGEQERGLEVFYLLVPTRF